MTDSAPTGPGGKPNVDLDEVARLVAALEQDLARVQKGSQNVQALRDEVEALRRILDASASEHHRLGDRLARLHATLEQAKETMVTDARWVADYLARIGRMLGL